MNIAELVETLAAQQSVKHICKCTTNLKDATRLWNWIDEQDNPEPLWSVMLAALPWAFSKPQGELFHHRVNSMRFTYDADLSGCEMDIGEY